MIAISYFILFASYCPLQVAWIHGIPSVMGRSYRILPGVTSPRWMSAMSDSNYLAKMKQALDSNKQSLAYNSGRHFEQEVQNELARSGYVNLLDSEESTSAVSKSVDAMIFKSMKGNRDQVVAEFDALAYGNRKAFDEFSCQVLDSYCPFRPKEGDSHIMMVEVKLNSELLMEWVTRDPLKGNKKLFLKPGVQELCKVAVINGGAESREFLANLRAEVPDPKYAACIKVLKEARVNVFYKPWASGETFSDLLEDNIKLKEDNEAIKKQVEDIQKLYMEVKKKLDL